MSVKQAALLQCEDALKTINEMLNETSNQVLYLALLAARQRVEAEEGFWSAN